MTVVHQSSSFCSVSTCRHKLLSSLGIVLPPPQETVTRQRSKTTNGSPSSTATPHSQSTSKQSHIGPLVSWKQSRSTQPANTSRASKTTSSKTNSLLSTTPSSTESSKAENESTIRIKSGNGYHSRKKSSSRSSTLSPEISTPTTMLTRL